MKAPTSDYLPRAVEVVTEDQQRCEDTQGQALKQPKAPLAGFRRTLYTSPAFTAGGEDE